jgi:hypothetical protein
MTALDKINYFGQRAYYALAPRTPQIISKGKEVVKTYNAVNEIMDSNTKFMGTEGAKEGLITTYPANTEKYIPKGTPRLIPTEIKGVKDPLIYVPHKMGGKDSITTYPGESVIKPEDNIVTTPATSPKLWESIMYSGYSAYHFEDKNIAQIGKGVTKKETAAEWEARRYNEIKDTGERVAATNEKLKEVAEGYGWKYHDRFTRMNKRTVYYDEENKLLYAFDTQHGRFEKCKEKNGDHLMEVDIDLKPKKPSDKTHSLRVK